MEPLLRAEEVMHLLGVSRSWFERLMAAGEGPACVRVGRMRRWRSQDVQRWIDTQVEEAQGTSREKAAKGAALRTEEANVSG